MSLIQSSLMLFINSDSQVLLLGFESTRTRGFLLQQEAYAWKSFQKIHLMGLPIWFPERSLKNQMSMSPLESSPYHLRPELKLLCTHSAWSFTKSGWFQPYNWAVIWSLLAEKGCAFLSLTPEPYAAFGNIVFIVAMIWILVQYYWNSLGIILRCKEGSWTIAHFFFPSPLSKAVILPSSQFIFERDHLKGGPKFVCMVMNSSNSSSHRKTTYTR